MTELLRWNERDAVTRTGIVLLFLSLPLGLLTGDEPWALASVVALTACVFAPRGFDLAVLAVCAPVVAAVAYRGVFSEGIGGFIEVAAGPLILLGVVLARRFAKRNAIQPASTRR